MILLLSGLGSAGGLRVRWRCLTVHAWAGGRARTDEVQVGEHGGGRAERAARHGEAAGGRGRGLQLPQPGDGAQPDLAEADDGPPGRAGKERYAEACSMPDAFNWVVV